MTVTLPDGMEYKNVMAQACADAVGSTVWGSEYPEEDGVRNLIVAVTGVRDEVGDIIVPGAFEHTLQRIEPKGCMGHDWNRVTGYPEAVEEVMPGDPRLPRTDRFGKRWPAEAGALFVRHRYHTDTDDGLRAYKDARFLGPRLACSIGYVDPKDDNGTPLHSYKAVDPVSGLMTRFLPRLDLFEYSQVLHGAHLLAGGVKDGKPKRLRTKAARPSMELKVRLVRDSAYWGLPLGTPIREGMKPQGPKARRLAAAGQQADTTAGAVEVDAANLRIKPTAKGKLKGEAAVDTAYSGVLSLIDELGNKNANLDSDDPIDPFDDSTFVVVDESSINKGELYNPLDILVANAISPAEVEEDLRNADWDNNRLGDAAERQDEIESFVADVVDAYRGKYNAELVRQNDSGGNEVENIPEASAEAPEAQDGQPAVDAGAPAPQTPHPADTEMTPARTNPQRVPPPSLEDGRTMQAADPLFSNENQSFELTGENGAMLRVYDLKRPADPKRPWTYDITTADGETIEGESTFRSPGSALVRAEGEFHEAEAATSQPQSSKPTDEEWQAAQQDMAAAGQPAEDPNRPPTSAVNEATSSASGVSGADAAPEVGAGVGAPAEMPMDGAPIGEADPAVTGEPLPGDIPAGEEGELVEDVDQAEAEAIEQNEELSGDEVADADEMVDASFGVTEAPDGEFEVDADVADRQDRVASLLAQSETGSLDLTGAADDQLRGTRADIVDELRLQQHLERRRTGEQAVTRQQAETQATDDLIPQEEADQPQDPGPKPRPGVAGAAEDLADAIDDDDQTRIDEATARLRKSVNRSRSDSEVVAEIRAMLDTGPELDPVTGQPTGSGLDPAALRDAAQRLRDEQRAKRNEGARRRRTARRFERERLRSLLGQVEAEMRNRDLDYDPLPDADGTVTLDLNTTPAVAWTTGERRFEWANTSERVDTLTGSGYTAEITTYVKPDGGLKPSDYRWTVTDDNGTVLATGSGTATDADSARASIEIALDTQRRLGLIPADAQIPQGSVPENTSATPLADVVDAIDLMRQRIDGGRKLNPITGKPDPFGDPLTPLPVPERSRFAGAEQVRKYLESRGVTRSGPGESHNMVDSYRWDTAKLTPGGAFAVVDDLQGKPNVVHTVTGATFPPPPLGGTTSLNRTDLLRYATIAESVRDRDGNLIDWNQGTRELVNDINSRSFIADGDGHAGLREGAVDRLTREKIQAGVFTHALVQRDITFIDGVTNTSRRQFVQDSHRTLAQLINVRRGKPDAFDKKTLDTATGARTLAALGAPDAASVLLTRRAAEIREQHGDNASSRGAAVLDALATGYLSMFSPMRSHGERVRSLKAGERLFLSGPSEDGGEPQLRAFRALSASRRDPRGTPSDQIVPVIDEKTGEQKFLHVSTARFRIEDTEDRTYGYAPLGGDLSHGDYAVVGPGEESPATVEDLRSRSFDDVSVIPQDVLDAAAEVVPESARETTARRAAAEEGRRAPRKGTPRAPKRTAAEPVAPEPVRNEQQLAQAQGKTMGAFLGMPFEYGGRPERGGFEDLAAVREHLTALESGSDDPRVSSSASAVLADLDSVKLSPGGVFLVRKDGTVTHISSSQRVWPPSPNSKVVFDEYVTAGALANQASGLRVARALESGVFDGEQVDWSGDGMKAVKQIGVIANRNGKFHPLVTAQRAAFRDGVLDVPKPSKTDMAMFTGVVGNSLDLEGPNPEAFDRSALLARKAEYSNSGGYAADSKKGADLATRISTELRLVEPLAKTAPLDAVRRLTQLADALDGQTITMRIEPGFAQRIAVHGAAPEKVKTLTPSDDLRAAASVITDVYDPGKISESARFRAAGMVGQVELTKPKITMGRTWEDPNGVAARHLESDIKESGGIRFYRDENGLLHATFNNSAGVPVDITEGQVQVGGGTTGAIKLAPDGKLTLSYMSANRLIVVEAPPRSWKFTPEQTGNEDSDGDISGPETESSQVDEGVVADIPGDAAPAAVEVEAAPDGGLEDRIRQAYLKLGDGFQDWVRLARLRSELGDANREEVDRVLLDMVKTGLVHLVASANRKVLTEEDNAAAIRIGDEDKHLIAIEEE